MPFPSHGSWSRRPNSCAMSPNTLAAQGNARTMTRRRHEEIHYRLFVACICFLFSLLLLPSSSATSVHRPSTNPDRILAPGQRGNNNMPIPLNPTQLEAIARGRPVASFPSDTSFPSDWSSLASQAYPPPPSSAAYAAFFSSSSSKKTIMKQSARRSRAVQMFAIGQTPNAAYTSPAPIQVSASRSAFNLTLGHASYIYDRWAPVNPTSASGIDECAPNVWLSSCTGGLPRAVTVFNALRSLTFTTAVSNNQDTGSTLTQNYQIISPTGFTPQGSLILNPGNFLSGAYWSQQSTTTNPLVMMYSRLAGFDGAGVGLYDFSASQLNINKLKQVPLSYSPSFKTVYDSTTLPASPPADLINLSPIPIIATNLYDPTGDPAIAGLFSKSQIYQMPGGTMELIGVLNYVPPETLYTSRMSALYPNIQLLNVTNDKSVFQTEITSLNQRYGINKIIVMLQYLDVPASGTTQPWDAVISYARSFLNGLFGVDVLLIEQRTITTPMPTTNGYNIITSSTGYVTAVTSCPPYMLYVCIQNVQFDALGNVVNAEAINQPLNSQANPIIKPAGTIPDPQATYVLDEPITAAQLRSDYTKFIQPLTSLAAGTSSVNETYSVCLSQYQNCTSNQLFVPLRFQETVTGNILADAFRQALGTMAAVINSGGIRSTFGSQTLTMADLISMLPLSNLLVSVSMRGEDVLLLLEQSVSASANDDWSSATFTKSGTGRFLQVSGLRFVWNPLAPVGQRVSWVQIQAGYLTGDVNYYDLQPEWTYTIGVTDYIVAGGDGYGPIFPSDRSRAVPNNITDSTGAVVPGLRMEVAARNYLVSMTSAGCAGGALCNPIKGQVEGRITRNKFVWPPIIKSITPLYADITSASVITVAGANLGLLPVVYTPTSGTSTGANPPISVGTPIPGVSINVGGVLCVSVSVAQINILDPSCQFNVVGLPNGANALASVSALTCNQLGNQGRSNAARVTVNTRIQSAYAAFSSDGSGYLGGVRASRLDTFPVFNYTVLTALQCPPDRSYLNAQGTCTCRPGWQVGTLNTGAKVCTQCLPGYYSTTDDSYACNACAAGTNSRAGDTSCSVCPHNTFSNSTGSGTCTPCPTHSSTLSLTGAAQCFCDAGYVAVYFNGTLFCNDCPQGAECISSLGVAKAAPGYWYDDVETFDYYVCPNNFCCDIHNGSGCLTTDAYRCYPHRHGFLCSQCDDGYSSIGGKECVKCPGPNGVILFVLALLAIIFIVFCLIENPSEDASTKLIVDYLQMCSLILNPNIGINDVLNIVHLEFGSATSQFNQCVIPLPPILGISASSLIPFGLFILLGLIQVFHWFIANYGCCCCCRNERWKNFYEANRWRYTNAAWQITLFGFMAIVSACVQLLDCRSVGNHYVVTLAPSVECFTGAHFGVAIVALALFCVLTFVVPIWLVSMLSELSKTTERRSSVFLHSMRQIKRLKKEYKRQKKAHAKAAAGGADGAGGGDFDQKILDIDEFLAKQMQQTKKVTRTGHEIVLWCYRADKYWCEAAFLLRRVVFTLVTVLLIREKAAMIVSWFCVLILVVHARFPVFRKQSSSFFHDFCLGAIIFQSALNLDIYAQDPTGYVDFKKVTNQAQVVIVYGITLLPIIIGFGLFFKEFLKERVRKKHAVAKRGEDGEEINDEVGVEKNSDDEEEDEEEEEEAVPAIGTTAENSSSFSNSRAMGHGAARDLAMGVMAQGPNVSNRNYNNAPVDLDHVLASANGAIISSPPMPNSNHPPVTIHF